MRGDSIHGHTPMPVEPADGQIELSRIAYAVWRNKRWIVIPAVLVAVASAAFVNIVTPMYRSEAQVLIENRETAYNRPDVERQGERDRPLLDAEAVQSQVQLAASGDLAREVVNDLKLAERAEFNPKAGGSPISTILALIGLARDPSRMTFDERVLERYYERLSVYPIERSRVIAIDFRSENPILAAEVANAVADRLLKFQQKAKQDSMRQASQWLASEIEQLRSRVAEAEAKAETFRGKSNLYIGSNNTSLSAQQLAESNTQFVQARTQKAEAETKARMIRGMLKSGRPIEASDIVNSELIRRLNEQRVILRAQLAEQSSTLLDQHPRIKELKAQIADLEAQTRTEAERLVRGLESDARIAGARLETLSANLDQIKKQASALGAEDVQLRALEREAKSQRDLLESYLSRYRDVTARESPDAVPPDARVLSRAVPSPTPYFPKKLPIVLIAAMATMMCAVTLIALGELMSGDPLRSPAEPLAAAPTRADAKVPANGRAPANEIRPRHRAAPDPPQAPRLAALADHVRALGRGIVVVTPAREGELGSAVAVDLARELVQRGDRVLLLNTDVAGVPAARLAGDPRGPGLGDLLLGTAKFGEAIQRDRASRLHVMTAGRGVRESAPLFAAERLAIVLGALSQAYSYVVLAAPPLVPMPGATRLARFSRCAIVAADSDEEAAAIASDKLAARGYRNVVVARIDSAPPDDASGRAAA